MANDRLDPVSNLATFRANITLRDATTGELWDTASLAAMTFKLRDIHTNEIVLEGELGDELLAVGAPADGVVQFTFSAAEMSRIEPKTYEMGALLTDDDGIVTQLFLGTVSVVEGL